MPVAGDPNPTPTPHAGKVTQPTSGTRYANYAEYVAQTLLANTVGSVPTIPNGLATGDVQTAVLTDPETIQAYRATVADQLNAQSNGPKFVDLSDRIAGIKVDTVGQGADTLQVTIIDPAWVLMMSGFFTVDETGYLWPPIDVNFPSDTDCVWRLCQLAATWDTNTQANLVLTLEDKIVLQLRDISPANGGLQQGSANQTLGGFFKMLVDSANTLLKTDIRLVELISPQDPNYTPPVTNIPKSATRRLNPNKTQRGLTQGMRQTIATVDRFLSGVFPPAGQATTLTSSESKVQQSIPQNPATLRFGPGI